MSQTMSERLLYLVWKILDFGVPNITQTTKMEMLMNLKSDCITIANRTRKSITGQESASSRCIEMVGYGGEGGIRNYKTNSLANTTMNFI